MELHSNAEDVLENPVVCWDSEEETNNHSTNGTDPKLTEAELCETHGYELAMSPARTIMPDDESVFSDSSESQTPSVPKMSTEEDFDLLDPFLLDSARSSKRPGRVSELTWFSDDSSDSQSSVVKKCTEEFDLLETCLYSSERASKPLGGVPESHENQLPCSEGQSCKMSSSENDRNVTTESVSTGEPSQAGRPAPSGGSIAETTMLVQALVRRMTLGQKMKFYAWFNSGLSIEEAALKSKIPDLIPPPVRHPNCKLSKRRLQRLSKILPNVFLQRQFVYETYFAGADPKQIMRYLVMGLESENLMDTFERQFMLEEQATKDKRVRRNMRERAAAAAAASAAAVAAATDGPTITDQPSDPNLQTGSGKLKPDIDPSGLRLKGNELKKYYFWRTQGLCVSEAVSKAKMPGLDREILPHPDCKHSWEKLEKLAKALPSSISRETFLVEVYYKGKNAGQVLKIVFSGGSDYCESEVNQAGEKGSGAEQNLFPENAVETSVHAAEILIDKPSDQPESVTSTEGVESLVNDEVSVGKSFAQQEDHPQRSNTTKPSGSRPKYNAAENDTTRYDLKKVRNEKHNSNETDSIIDPKDGVRPVSEARCNGETFEIPRMSLNKQKKYYKWRNQGFGHSEALDRAQNPGLIPESTPHPGCKHSWKEVKDMSSAISHKHERHKFQVEVFYGGKKPEEVMKSIFLNDRDQTMNEDTTALSQMCRNKLKKYYKWRILGLSPSEALSKAKVPGLIPETEGPHPDCKHSWDEIKEIGSTLRTKSARDRFQVTCFYGGKDPHELLKHMKTDVNENSNASESNIQTSKAASNSVNHGAHFTVPLFIQNGLGIENTVSEEMGVAQPGVQITSSGKKDDLTTQPSKPVLNSVDSGTSLMPSFPQNELGVKNAITGETGDVHLGFENPSSPQGDPVLELSNRPLKKYYAWRNKGLSHNDAFLKATTKSGNLSGKEANELYVAHPDCTYSRDELIRLSLVFDEKGMRDRFFVHTFFGGMDPECAMNLLKSRINQLNRSDSCSTSKSQKSRRKIHIKYLMGKGLTREEALRKLRNPSKELLKELEEFILVNCGKKRVVQPSHSSLPADQNSSSLVNPAASTNIPLSSPYHPSKLLTDSQLINYYLWISNGYSREEAFKKVMNLEPVSRDMCNFHYLRSRYNLEEVKKMSKNLPNEALAKTFVIETFYGQNDPEELMEFLSPLANSLNVGSCSQPCQVVRQDIAENPWFPSNQVQDFTNSIHPAAGPSTVSPVFADGLRHPDPALQLPFQADLGQSYLYDPAAFAEPPTCLPFQFQAAGPATMDSSGYPHPTVDPSPSYLNTIDTIEISDSSNHAPSSKEEAPETENPALEGNEVQCFIVPADFPNETLTASQMDAVENNILEAILEMDDGEAKPSFKDSFRSSGRYGVICLDEFSVDWLYKYLRVYEPWEGALLRLITKRSTNVRANAVLPLCKGDDDAKILKFIEKQNFGLKVGRWTVVQRWDSSDGNTVMDLIIDEESAEILRKCSRISFKLGWAEIITAQKTCSPSRSCHQGSSSHVTGMQERQSSASPLPPSSPPHPSLPPPPPPKPCVIDTSLGALLKSSASKTGNREHFQKMRSSSPHENGHEDGCTVSRTSPEREESRTRKDPNYTGEGKRSRSSSQDSFGRAIPRISSPGRIHKRRRSAKDLKRSASRSTSRDKSHRKKSRKCSRKDRKSLSSNSPSLETSANNDSVGKNHTWQVQCRFYPGDEKPSPGRFLKNPISARPRSLTPCSVISSEDNLSLPDDETHPTARGVRAASIENTEYDQYVSGSSCPKPLSSAVIDLTDST